MNTRASPGRLHWVVAATFLLAGCGAAASPPSAPVATPAVALATPTPTATPSLGPDRTYVSGTMTCRIVGGEDHEEKPGDYNVYQLSIDCAFVMSDPRVTGTAHYSLAATFIGLEPTVEGTSNFWTATSTLETKDGTWTGSGYGSEFVSDKIKPLTLYTNGTDVFEGQGAYAGLTYRVLWARETPVGAGLPYDVSGWIEPAE